MSANCIYTHPDKSSCELLFTNPNDQRCDFHRQLEHKSRRYSAGTSLLRKYISTYTDKGELTKLCGIKFEKLEFSDSILPEDPVIIFDGATFIDCDFHDWTLFDASFKGCTFKDSTFRNIHFKGQYCSFEQADFRCKETIFDECIFEFSTDELDDSYVNFNNASIIVDRQLFSSTIVKASQFTMAQCELDARYFSLIVANLDTGPVYLSTLTLNSVQLVSFIGFRFNGSFHYNHHVASSDFTPTVYMIDVNFSLMNYVHFRNANFEKTIFTNSAIESINFSNCVWPVQDGYKHLCMESVEFDSQVKKPEQLIKLYTQLKRNFEDARDYIGAGDWFFREMEARRRQIKLELEQGEKKRIYLFTTNLYKFISNYGESYTKPLSYLGLILILFAPLHMLSGFVIDEQLINYRFANANIFTSQHLTDFANSLVASFSAMTLQGGKIVTFRGLSSNFLYIFQFLITAILVPLFLLALRRKFRR